MKVFFGATTAGPISNPKYYFKIREFLIENNCVILFDWLENAFRYKKKSPYGKRHVRRIFENVVDAINRSDLVVIEYTTPNFSSSHQINYALSRQKPVLVLRRKKDNTFADSYLDAINSRYLTIVDYKLSTLEQEIKSFIGLNQTNRGLSRYNIVLEGKQKFYLDWLAETTDQSRSLIVRQLIDSSIKNDPDFQKYISDLK